jgi:hypothetical protein
MNPLMINYQHFNTYIQIEIHLIIIKTNNYIYIWNLPHIVYYKIFGIFNK